LAKSEEFGALLYAALAEPIGLLCQGEPSFALARQRLYAARKKLGDPALDILQFRASPFPEGNLVIVKESIQLPAEETSHESAE